jgi:hypothetical protein
VRVTRAANVAIVHLQPPKSTSQEETNMRKFTIATAVTLALSLTAVGAHAIQGWAESSNRYVEMVSTENNLETLNGVGSVYLNFSSTPFTTSCSAGHSLWKIGGDAESVKSIQSAALAAKLARVRVRVVWNNSYSSTWSCSGGGTNGYPMLRGLTVRPASE